VLEVLDWESPDQGDAQRRLDFVLRAQGTVQLLCEESRRQAEHDPERGRDRKVASQFWGDLAGNDVSGVEDECSYRRLDLCTVRADPSLPEALLHKTDENRGELGRNTASLLRALGVGRQVKDGGLGI
jgi:hypothetical protein